MADKNRGGRSVNDDDDSFDENDDDLQAEAEVDAELDDDGDTDDESFDEDDDAPASTRRRATAGAGAGSGTATKVKSKEARRGPLGRLVTFVREIYAELQKVIWPTRKELLTYTSVVIVFVAVMMAYVSGLDVGFAKLMLAVFGHVDAE